MQRRSARGAGMAIAAALIAMLSGAPTRALAQPTRGEDSERLVAALAQLAGEAARIADGLRANLARKQNLDAQDAALVNDVAQLNKAIADSTAYCSGSYAEAEYRRRTAVCAGRESEFARRREALAARRRALDAADAARNADAAALRAAYEANQQRVKSTSDTLSRDSTLAAIWAPCAGQPSLAARSKCLGDGWAAAGTAAVKAEQDEFDRMNAAWLRRQESEVRAAAAHDARWRKEMLAAIDEMRPPPPDLRPASLIDTKPGDILLLVPEAGFAPTRLIPPADWLYRVVEHWESGETFREAVQTPKAPVSHAVTVVKSVKGQLLFLDHTAQGSRIMTKADFERKYGMRGMFMARPQAPVDGRVLWDAASSAARRTSTTGKSGFGIGCNNKVCTMLEGMAVAKATGLPVSNRRFGPIDITPGDFFDEQASGKFFVITPLAH